MAVDLTPAFFTIVDELSASSGPSSLGDSASLANAGPSPVRKVSWLPAVRGHRCCSCERWACGLALWVGVVAVASE